MVTIREISKEEYISIFKEQAGEDIPFFFINTGIGYFIVNENPHYCYIVREKEDYVCVFKKITRKEKFNDNDIQILYNMFCTLYVAVFGEEYILQYYNTECIIYYFKHLLTLNYEKEKKIVTLNCMSQVIYYCIEEKLFNDEHIDILTGI